MEARTKREELSDHLLHEHDLVCLESELDLIINIIESYASRADLPVLSHEEIKKMAIARYYASGDNHEKGLIQGFQDGYNRALSQEVKDQEGKKEEGNGWFKVNIPPQQTKT